jgi:diacylglycerol O-acyltransferase / wax synthase
MSFQQLDPLDSAFVTLEVPGAPLHIGVIIEMEVPDDGLDSKQRFDLLKANIAARMHEIPVLTKRVLRTPFDLAWPVIAEDPEFDIDAHVIRRAVTSPGGDDQLDALAARVMSRELAPDRPLWELNYIEGLANGRAAVIMKVHHALADGVSGAATVAGLFDLSPEVRVPTPPAPRTTPIESLPSPLELLSRTSGELIKRPVALMEVVAAALERVADMVEQAAASFGEEKVEDHQPSILQAKTTSINGTPGYAKKFKRLRVSLPEVKVAAKSRGASVTDFVMASVSGGLRRLFEERGEELAADLVAFVPISVRSPGTEGEMGNQISAMLSELRTDIADPEERLRLIAASSKEAAKVQRDKSARLLMNLANAAGPTVASVAGRTLAALQLFEHLPPIANLTVSSVPGPPIPLWLSGHRVATVAPLGPLMAGLALNVTVISYCDQLEYGLLACTRRVPELALLRDYIEEEANYYLKTPAPVTES